MAALRGRAGRGWQPFGGDTKREGRGQSQKVSTGEGKQRRQARSDWIHTDLPGSTGCQRSTVGCGSLAKVSSLNPGSRQHWLSAQHMGLIFCRKPRKSKQRSTWPHTIQHSTESSPVPPRRQLYLARHHPGKQEPFRFNSLFLMCFLRGVAGMLTPPETHQPVLHTGHLEQSYNYSTVSRPSTETLALPGQDEQLWDGTIAITPHLHPEPSQHYLPQERCFTAH